MLRADAEEEPALSAPTEHRAPSTGSRGSEVREAGPGGSAFSSPLGTCSPASLPVLQQALESYHCVCLYGCSSSWNAHSDRLPSKRSQFRGQGASTPSFRWEKPRVSGGVTKLKFKVGSVCRLRTLPSSSEASSFSSLSLHGTCRSILDPANLSSAPSSTLTSCGLGAS